MSPVSRLRYCRCTCPLASS